jgi:hypothetical protein
MASPRSTIYISSREGESSLAKSILSSHRLRESGGSRRVLLATGSNNENLSYIAPYSQMQKQKIKEHMERMDRRKSLLNLEPLTRRRQTTLVGRELSEGGGARWGVRMIWVALVAVVISMVMIKYL